jgi:hypothetical protein
MVNDTPTSIPSHGEADPRLAIVRRVQSMGLSFEDEARVFLEELDAHMLSDEVVERVAKALFDRATGGKLKFIPSQEGRFMDEARAALRSLAGGK